MLLKTPPHVEVWNDSLFLMLRTLIVYNKDIHPYETYYPWNSPHHCN